MSSRTIFSKRLPDPNFTVDCPHPDMPEFMTLDVIPGTFEVVKIDPNTDKRTIAWSMPHRSMSSRIGDREIETTMPVEQFAGQPCAVAVLVDGNYRNILIGLRTAEGGAVNEQNPHSLRLLSLWPVVGKAGHPVENAAAFMLTGRRWPKKSLTNITLAGLTLYYVIFPGLILAMLPVFLILSGLLHNDFLAFVLACILPPLVLIGGAVGFKLYWNSDIASPRNYVHADQSSRAFVRDVVRDLDDRDCFAKAIQDGEHRKQSTLRLEAEAAERRWAAGQSQPAFLF